jgi:hypothetical protein
MKGWHLIENSKALKIVALIFAGFTIAILLLFGLGETIGGDWSGLGHLIQAMPIGLLMWLGWKRPFWGGLFLIVLSLLASYSYADALRGPGWLAPFLIIIAPLFASGVLLMGAAGLEKRIEGLHH